MACETEKQVMDAAKVDFDLTAQTASDLCGQPGYEAAVAAMNAAYQIWVDAMNAYDACLAANGGGGGGTGGPPPN